MIYDPVHAKVAFLREIVGKTNDGVFLSENAVTGLYQILSDIDDGMAAKKAPPLRERIDDMMFIGRPEKFKNSTALKVLEKAKEVKKGGGKNQPKDHK